MKLKIRICIFAYLAVLFGLERLKCPFVASFTLLGLNGYGQTKVRTVVEMYKIYDRSFNFIFRNKFFSERKKIDVISPQWSDDTEHKATNSDEKLDAAMKNEFSHAWKQADYGTSLTDFQVTLFVQFMSLSYSFQFIEGFLHFYEENDTEKSLACLKLAYYLAWFGSESRLTVKSITKILKIKYPAANEKFSQMNESLKMLQERIRKIRVRKTREEILSNKEFQTEIELVTSYFREMVLGEPKIFEDEYFDLDENIKLWARANKFVNHLYASYETQYYNMDSGQKNLFRSNVASILRDIELFKAERSFSKSALKNLHVGYVDEYLTVRRWSANRTLIFALFPYHSEQPSSQKGTASFLGITQFESDDIRAEMIVLNNYQKGYHYANKMKFHTRFEFYEHWFAFIVSDFYESDKMGFELKYVYWQSISATCLTELFSILFVQYMSAVYAFRLAHGFDYFQERGDEDDAEYCAVTSYYLAWFATKDDVILAAIEKVLREKYPKKSNLVTPVANAMRRISSVVRGQISRKYNERKLESFDPGLLRTKKLHLDVQTTNTFFRRLLTGRNFGWESADVTTENTVDLEGDQKLWHHARKLYSLVRIGPDEKFENPITGQNDMNLSTVSSIIQVAELLSVENKFSNHVYIAEAGMTDEFFATKLFRDEFGVETFQFEEISTRNLFPQIDEYSN